jgi:7,8-dihydropterin-6-yl-methyl-4-(beta-D-ribofuranosyl)aminobenzene 5'-phosphate synthase
MLKDACIVQQRSLPVNLEEAAEDVISRTIGELKALDPQLVMPCHCTGFEATRRFAEEMPGQLVLGTVGTTLNL